MLSCRASEIVILGQLWCTATSSHLLNVRRAGTLRVRIHRRQAPATATTLPAAIFIGELLVRSDLIASVPGLHTISIVGAFLADDGYFRSVHGPAGPPLVPGALIRCVQILNEIALIVLTTNDAFLCTSHARAQKTSSRAHLLWRLVLLGSYLGDTVHHGDRVKLIASKDRIESIVLEVASVQQQSLQSERFALKAAVLDIIVRWGVIHEVLHARLGLVRVQDCLRMLLLLRRVPLLGRWLATRSLLDGASASLHRTRHEGGLGHLTLQVALVFLELTSVRVSMQDFLDLLDARVPGGGAAAASDLGSLLLS